MKLVNQLITVEKKNMAHRNPGQKAPTPHDGERRGLLSRLTGRQLGATVAAAGELAEVDTHIGDKLPPSGQVMLKHGSEMFSGKPAKDGSFSTLRGVVEAGGSMVALVERRQNSKTTGFALVRTGLGHNAPDGQPRTGVIIAEVSQSELTEPGTDRVIQPWKTVHVGREDLNGDPEASHQHLSVTVQATGEIMVSDGWIDERNFRPSERPSTNGTSVLSGSHFGFKPEGGEYAGPDVAIYNALAGDEARWNPTAIQSLPVIAQGKHVLSMEQPR